MVVVDESYVPPATLPTVGSSASSIKVMSYNVMGWSACGRRRRRNLPSRGKVITEKIRAWDPAVLGAQEVETGGGSGSKDCEDALVANTDLNSGLYKEEVLENLGSSWTNLKGGYWMAGARYKHKKSGAEFLFFNSHWKHGYGLEQAKIAAAAIDEERKKYSSLPTLFMGDTNQFCKGYESDAYKYLTGQLGSSPVKFVDVHAGDWGGSFGNGDCRIDFMFASADQWSLVDASIDREGMNDVASDHAALRAELVPQSR
jgi:endonuclease/exonuclease/phosphatase family metal-dependent hydrolase